MKYKIVPTPWGDRTALNLTRVIADGAGDVYIGADQFFRIGQVNMGVQLQAVGTIVTPSFTLAPPELAANEDPSIAAAQPWMALASVASGNMVNYPLATTAVKLHFATAGEATLVSW